MKGLWRGLLTAGLGALAAAALACGEGQEAAPVPPVPGFALTSQGFGPQQAIPPRYTCDGENLSPPLAWNGAPEGTVTFALTVDDLDAGGFAHWVILDIRGDATGLPEGVGVDRPRDGATHGRNDFGRFGYGGPCPPPDGAHRYRFRLYALDIRLGLEPGVSLEDVGESMQGHILAQAELVGTYARAEQ